MSVRSLRETSSLCNELPVGLEKVVGCRIGDGRIKKPFQGIVIQGG